MNVSEKRIKICGMTRLEDILAVNAWKPDYAGFVFAPGKRQLTIQKARELKEALLPEILSTGVFVNSPIYEIAALGKDKIIDVIQLHGDEDTGYIQELKKNVGPGFPIIKAVRVKNPEDIIKAEEFPCDYLLFDTYSKNFYGGSGKTFDWSMIPEIKKPWFLAGGLHASNLKAAMNTQAYCLDLSSGVETDGKKDPEKIKEIIQIVRRKQ